jgi:hypothetical protein
MRRLSHAWRELDPARRLAALAAGGLFVSMFLPWYSKTDTVLVRNAVRGTQTSLSAFEAFSFVEAAVLLVSAGVLALLLARAEERDFQLPGGDGLVVMVAGGWVALLIFYRLLDKPGLRGNERITATVGVEWGIFIALLLALGLLYAGRRMRAEARPQPPLLRSRDARPPRDPRPPQRPEDRELGRDPSQQETTVRRGPAAGPAAADAPANGERLLAPVPARAREGGETADPATPAPPAPSPIPEARKPSGRPRFPPAPGEQMSFEDPPPRE